MTRFLRALTAVLLLLPGFANATLYDNKVVEKIDVIFVNEPADSVYSVKNVTAKIRTRAGDVFSQNDFDNDLKSLVCDYDHVEPQVQVIDTNLYITLKIWPKPVIRSLRWEGACKLALSKLQGESGICVGGLFDRSDFNRALHKVRALYVKDGFFEADLDFTAEMDPSCNSVDIVICVNEGRSGRIKKIQLCGFTPCEECDVSDLMCTKEYNFFTSWITNQGTYNEDAIQIDQFRILNYLHDLGYADAQVDIDVLEAQQCDRIIISITATKGEQYYCGPITFEGNCIFEDENIQGRFCVCEGGIYSPEQIRNTIKNISDLYGRYGYIDAVVDYEAKLVPDQNCYTLHITIEEGEQYRVGLIKIFGNCRTQNRVILHECLLIPGEVFNVDKLKKSEERLTNVGYFKCVNVYIAQNNDQLGLECNYRDVHIEVEEQGTGHFGAFFGYSTAEDLFDGISITEKNFNYKGLGRVWSDGFCALRGGGEYLHFTANVGQKASSYVISWTEPYFMDTPWSVGIDVERTTNRYIAKDYDIKAYGGALHASYPLNPFTRFGWHYRVRDTHVTVQGQETNSYLQDAAKINGLISASGVSLNFDSTDCPGCPTNGFRSRMELEYTGLGGDHHFWGFAYLNTYYYSLCKQGVLKFRGDVRFLLPVGHTTKNTLPLDERLFLGGENQVRGYRPYAIGPKIPLTTNPAGGVSLALLSAEYNHKFFEELDGFLFLDAGELSGNQVYIGNLNYSAGFGMRVKVFESGPPLTIGMGFPLNPRTKSDVKKLFWTIGGRF